VTKYLKVKLAKPDDVLKEKIVHVLTSFL